MVDARSTARTVVEDPRVERSRRFILEAVLDELGAVGYGEGDIGSLVDGTLKQQRLLATAPREVTEADLAGIFLASMSLW